jgi:hypothetical protein
VLLEGINDIGFPGAIVCGHELAPPSDAPTPEDLIDAYRQLISHAHVHGVKVIGATITPFEGVAVPGGAGYYSESKEGVRQAVNKWIRTVGSFDGVIDFDAALRDPDHPRRVLTRFASPDQSTSQRSWLSGHGQRHRSRIFQVESRALTGSSKAASESPLLLRVAA